MVVLWWSLVVAGAAEPDCVSAYGQTACGYHCEAAYGQVKCAQTPEGRCTSAYGEVTCWDPAVPRGRAFAHDAEPDPAVGQEKRIVPAPKVWESRSGVPEAECVSAYGETACGYGCESAYGQVACADWPGGACESAYGQVVCGPPAPRGWRAWGEWPRAECVSAYGEIACGYACEAAYGDVKCARTPQGTCTSAYGEITCFDPAPHR